MNALVLYTQDLRVHDNETLLQAIREADNVLCAYALQEEASAFVLESLRDLRAVLKDLGATLIVRKQPTKELVNDLCEEYDIDVVYAQERPSLPVLSTPTKTYPTHMLYHPQDLVIQPENKESFMRLTENLFPPMAYAKPTNISEVPAETTPIPEKPREDIAGGETAAHELLNELLESGGDASLLGAHLDAGTISPRTVFYKSLDEEKHTNKDFRILRYALRERDYQYHQTNTTNQ